MSTLEVNYIKIAQKPSKTEYLTGETLNLTGIKVNAIHYDYETGQETIVADVTSQCTFVPPAGTKFNKVGTETIKALYKSTSSGGVSTTLRKTFTVNVSRNTKIYRVEVDGVNIYDPAMKDMTLLKPKLHTEFGAAGNFEFTIQPNHVFYDRIIPYGSNIEVFEEDVSIFFGRALPPTIDFYNNKKYHCEGMLAFLNDSRPQVDMIEEHIGIRSHFEQLITMHNRQQKNPDRQFFIDPTIANVTVVGSPDTVREYKVRNTIMDHIRTGCVATDGGYLYAYREGGENHINWYEKPWFSCNQKLQFAINLLDISRFSSEGIYTGAIASGGESYINGETVTLLSPVWADQEIRDRYGDILKYLEFPDTRSEEELAGRCESWLEKQQFEDLSFSTDAADMHFFNPEYESFKIGQNIHVYSVPHFVNALLPVTQIDYELDTGKKKITIGTMKRQSYSTNVRNLEYLVGDVPTGTNLQKEIEQINSHFGVGYQAEYGTPEHVPVDYWYMRAPDGNRYAAWADPVSGNVIIDSSKPVPVRIQFTKYKTPYYVGDTLDLADFEVTAFYGDGTEVDVTADCLYELMGET